MFFKISLAGDLGSGKSTVGKILGERFGAEIVSIGRLQRKMASDLGMDTCDFNRYQESHPEFDKILDGKLAEYEKKEGNYIFDSRLAWHFVPSSFAVYLKCDREEAARRIIGAKRDDESYEDEKQALERLFLRRASEKERYLDFYGVDITDMNNYDLVIDTTDRSPEAVAEEIVKGWKNHYKI